MTTYEILKMNESFLQMLSNLGVSINDVNHLRMYEEFCEMKEQGLKVRYIALTLAEKYCLSERAVFKIAKRLEQQSSI